MMGRQSLTNRMQYTKIGRVVLELEPVMVGVPQRSVLGLLLFILYINDSEKWLETSNLHLHMSQVTALCD